MGEIPLNPSLADALVAPLQAFASAQRSLSAATLEFFRAGLVADASGGHQTPRTRVLTLGAPSPLRIALPALALAPVPHLAITGARVELTWQPTVVVSPAGGAGAVELRGRPAAPRAVTRQTDRSPKIAVRVQLRGQAPAEGRRRVDDRLTARRGAK